MSTPGEKPTPSPEPSEPFAAVLRRAAIQGALFGVAFAAGGTGALAWNDKLDVFGTLGLPIGGFLAGFCIAPLGVLEGLARRRAPSLVRDLAIVALGALLGCGLVFLATVQFNVTLGAMSGGLAGALGGFERILDFYTDRPMRGVPLTAAFGVALGPLALARVRRLHLALQVPAVTIAAFGLAVPFVLATDIREGPLDRFALLAPYLLVAPVLGPPALRLADAVAARLERRLASDHEG